MKKILIALAVLVALVAGCTPAASSTPGSTQTSSPTLASIPTQCLLPDIIGKATIKGEVLSGGDTTPKGLVDAPRVFVYQVKLEDGALLEVSYTAFPPSPVGDKQKIRLEFHNGQIQAGDLIEAFGTYDPASKRLTAAEEGDYIITTEKP